MREKGIGTLRGYGIAFLLLVGAVLLRVAFTPLIGERLPYGTFFLALSVGALLLDRGPAVALWLAGGVLAGVLFIVPYYGFVGGSLLFETSYYLLLGGAILASGQFARSAGARVERARAEIAESAERYKRLFDLSGVGFAIAEDPACERITANAWLADRLGIAPGANVSRAPTRPQPYRVFRHGRELDVAELPLSIASTTGQEVRDAELELVDSHGRRTDLLGYASPLRDERGGVTGALSAYVDITARKRAMEEREQLLAASEAARGEAERANRAKDAFLATISHELRTPLSPILTWTRLLARPALSETDRTRGLSAIERCATSQARLIEDLLDVSRIVAGKMRLDVRPVPLATVIEAALEIVRPAADAKSIRLTSVLDTKECQVSGDAERLQQAVWNLLSNAIKFTPKTGRVHVVLERVNSHVEIGVSDTGEGIEPAFMPFVFERFSQADASLARAHTGLGLGLAITRHIIELHGGTVHAESPGAGRGSVFTIKLPLLVTRNAGEPVRRHPTSPPTDWADAIRPPDASLEGAKVLVVEDEPDSNATITALLRLSGAEVRAADGVDVALCTLAEWTPHVVVTDIGMPGKDGYEFIARVRDLPDPIGKIPMVALTAYAGTDDRIRLVSAGFAFHIPKPFDPDELVAVVASTVRGGR